MAQHLRNLTARQATARSAADSGATSTSPNHGLPLQILLVPLSDSPTLPSLSLLLAQGTTPSAVCFQQDLLERARRTEDDWLPSALDMITIASTVTRQTSVPGVDVNLPRLSVVAYSANPALAESVVMRCKEAGAIGVLQPPYDNNDTLAKIQEMIAAPLVSRSLEQMENVHEPDTPMDNLGSVSSIDSDLSPVTPPEIEEGGPLDMSQVDKPNPAQNLYASWAAYDLASRRRSVDTGGLALAIARATVEAAASQGSQRKRARTGEHQDVSYSVGCTPDMSRRPSQDVSPAEPVRQDRSASLYPDHTTNPELEVMRRRAERRMKDGEDTMLAEILGEMYRQTKTAIEVQMVDFPE